MPRQPPKIRPNAGRIGLSIRFGCALTIDTPQQLGSFCKINNSRATQPDALTAS
jgi:hypothetical protein